MSKPAFTPGPWHPHSQSDGLVIVGPSGYYHATVVGAAEGDRKAADEAVATARLIAAAPDLFDAALAILAAHESLFAQCASNPVRNAWGSDVDVTLVNAAAATAEAAIRKAEGR